jgi:Na+/alanine symporter
MSPKITSSIIIFYYFLKVILKTIKKIKKTTKLVVRSFDIIYISLFENFFRRQSNQFLKDLEIKR